MKERDHIEAKHQTDTHRRQTLCGLVVRWADAGASPRFPRRGDCKECREIAARDPAACRR